MRYLSLDVGEKTIGIAISDILGMTAQGVETIFRNSLKSDLQRIGEIILNCDVTSIIFGYPKNMDGSEGERCQFVKNFAKKVAAKFPEIEIIFWDERLTTVEAEKILISADLSRKKRKKIIDKIAAIYILQSFLDNKNKGF